MTMNKKMQFFGGLLALALGIASLVVGLSSYYRDATTGEVATRLAQTFGHTATYSISLGVTTMSLILVSMGLSNKRL
jgi:hypothetical protein